MDNTTANTVGTIAGAFAASFLAQLWGNFVTRKAAKKIIVGTAAQTTSNDILNKVNDVERQVEVLVKQPGIVSTVDHRSPKKG